MGGGAMLRYAGKTVGLGAGRAAAPLQHAYWKCKNSSKLNKGRAQSSAACLSQGCSVVLQPVSDRQSEVEFDWEFAGDDDLRFPERGVFGPVPTRQEVEEAASDLQAAVTRAVHPFSASEDYETAYSNPVQQSSDFLKGSTSLERKSIANQNAFDRTEPELHPCNHELVQQPGHNNVFDAFHLLQTNPAVQGMVISLASDKAIWDAVLKNESVLEFRRSLHKVAAGNSKLQEITRDSDESFVGKPNVFISAIKNVKMKSMDCMERITELIGVILGFADKKVFAEQDGGIMDRTLKASLMLSVAVLLVVVVKRVQ